MNEIFPHSVSLVPLAVIRRWRRVILCLLLFAALPELTFAMESELPGEGETRWTRMYGISTGAGFGSFIFGGVHKHDFMYFNIHYGRVISERIADGSHWAGRWMILGELTAGWEVHPGNAQAVGVTPLVRYQFETSKTYVPFIEAGYGLTWTNIGKPDLGGKWQFNAHAGAGLYWFLRADTALTFQYRFVHYSNAGLRRTNSGVNLHGGLIGVSYFY